MSFLVHGIRPNTSSESLQVAIGINLRCTSTRVPFSAILNLLFMCETFGKFVLLRLMVQSQASKYSTS